jgi:RimJ/RimL family protein N-acetyltransferase
MRTAILHLAFEGLGAQRAESAAWHDNAQSRGVSMSVGYAENGDELKPRNGKADRQVRFVMDRAMWEARRRDDVTIEGLEPCLPFFGAVEAEWLLPEIG